MTTWILLRGLMREARHWGTFPQQFAAHMQHNSSTKVQVFTPDFAGNGSLSTQQSANSVELMAEQLREQLRARHIKPPYHVLALSLGAMAAVAWASSAPQDIARLVLINTSLQPFNPFYRRLRPQNYPRLLAMLLRGSMVNREQTILDLTSNLTPPQQRAELHQAWLGYAQQNPVSRKNILRQLLAAMHYRAPQQAPAIPLLMLAAQQDQLVSVRCSEAIAGQWSCPLQLHPHAGHDLPLDDAAWVAQQVNAWIANR